MPPYDQKNRFVKIQTPSFAFIFNYLKKLSYVCHVDKKFCQNVNIQTNYYFSIKLKKNKLFYKIILPKELNPHNLLFPYPPTPRTAKMHH